MHYFKFVRIFVTCWKSTAHNLRIRPNNEMMLLLNEPNLSSWETSSRAIRWFLWLRVVSEASLLILVSCFNVNNKTRLILSSKICGNIYFHIQTKNWVSYQKWHETEKVYGCNFLVTQIKHVLSKVNGSHFRGLDVIDFSFGEFFLLSQRTFSCGFHSFWTLLSESVYFSG